MPRTRGIWHRHGDPATLRADPAGRVVPWQRAHSYTWNMLRALQGSMKGDSPVIVTGSDNNALSLPDARRMFYMGTAGTSDGVGLVLGSGNTMEGTGSHDLAAKYPHGSGAGQIDYGAQVVDFPVNFGTSTIFVVGRTFYNANADPLPITEQGLFAWPLSAPDKFYLMVYDALGASWDIQPGVPTLVQYTFNAQG